MIVPRRNDSTSRLDHHPVFAFYDRDITEFCQPFCKQLGKVGWHVLHNCYRQGKISRNHGENLSKSGWPSGRNPDGEYFRTQLRAERRNSPRWWRCLIRGERWVLKRKEL